MDVRFYRLEFDAGHYKYTIRQNVSNLGKIRKALKIICSNDLSELCVFFVQVRVRQEWWDTRCLATVFLETPSTLHHAWSPRAYVRDAFI